MVVVVVVLAVAIAAVGLGVFVRAVFGGSTFPRDRTGNVHGVRPDAGGRPEGTGLGPWGTGE